MIKIRWGLGGLFVLWVIAMALWAAVGLARSARGELNPAVGPHPAPAPKSGLVAGPVQIAAPPPGERVGETSCTLEVFECEILMPPEVEPVAIPDRSTSVEPRSAESTRWVLSLAQPMNPVRGPLVVSLALSSASPASLALIDVAGRRMAEEAVGGLGPGPHRVTLARRPAAGVYWLVLRQESQTLRKRLVVL